MYVLTIARDLKVKKNKKYLSVFYGKIDITKIVAQVFSMETKEVEGKQVILNSKGMGISIEDYLKAKIKLEENQLVQPICDYLMSLEFK